MLSELYYGNTILQWSTASLLFVCLLVASKTFYWICKNVLASRLKKSGKVLPALIIDMIEEPVIVLVLIAGLRLILRTLSIDKSILDVLNYTFNFLLAATLTWLITRLYNSVHEKYFVQIAEQTKTTLDDHLLPLFQKGMNVAIWAVGIIVALNNAGFEVTPLLAGLGIGGLAIGLAFQHTFGNILSGLLIYTDNHFKIGDRIKLEGKHGGIDGNVTRIGLRTTTVVSRYEGREINIPNSFLTDRDVVNVESEDGRQVFSVYKLAPDTSASLVEEFMSILKECVKSTNGTKDFILTGLLTVNEIGHDVMLVYWVRSEASTTKTKTAVNLKILKEMENHEIKFSEKTSMRYNKGISY